jgi:hypothetical protein
MKLDMEIVQIAIEQDPTSIKYIPEMIRDKKEIRFKQINREEFINILLNK